MNETPIINTSIDDEVIFSPSQYFEYKEEEGHKIPKLPESCLLVFEDDFLDHAVKHMKLREIDWFRKQFKLYTDGSIVIAKIHYGAALSAIALEELIALGVKRIITIGSAGSLQEHVPIGSIVLADNSIREEGTSYHYMPPSRIVSCSQDLLDLAMQSAEKAGKEVKIGTCWTTDSFYRETIKKARGYKEEGVLVVDMESSALYAVANYRGVDILSMFYISDSIAGLKWRPKFAKSKSEEMIRTLLRISVDALAHRQ